MGLNTFLKKLIISKNKIDFISLLIKQLFCFFIDDGDFYSEKAVHPCPGFESRSDRHYTFFGQNGNNDMKSEDRKRTGRVSGTIHARPSQ